MPKSNQELFGEALTRLDEFARLAAHTNPDGNDILRFRELKKALAADLVFAEKVTQERAEILQAARERGAKKAKGQ